MSKCPICGAPTAARFRPFCSRRCADIDLGRWMNGSYAIAAEEEDRPDIAPAGDDPADMLDPDQSGAPSRSADR